MPVFLEVQPKLDASAAQLAAREAIRLFTRAGEDAGKAFSNPLGKALNALDTSSMRRQLGLLQADYAKLASAEEAAAIRMTRAMGQVEVAQRRLMELTKGVADASVAGSARMARAEADLATARAVAAREQRGHVDAMVGSEAAAGRLATATDKAGASVSRSGQVFNAVGVASVVGLGAALIEGGKAAGNFQQSQVKLQAVTGETAQNLKIVSDGVLQLAGQVGISAQKLMNSMFLVEKAGYSGADGIKVLTAASQLATEEGADLNETVSAVTTTLHDFHIPAAQAADITSKLNVAVGLSKVPLSDFAGALHNVEPTARAAGESVQDLYAALAMLTQSGMGADQASQNLTHAITSLSNPTQQMIGEMGALGIDFRQIQADFSSKGLTGTAQELYQAVQQKLGPSGKVMLDTWYKSQAASDSANQMMAAMPPEVQKVAESIDNGTLSYAEFRRTRGGLSVEQANEIEQWKKVENALTGYNNALKSGKGDTQSQIQALALLVGGQDNLRTILQLSGQEAPQTAAAVKKIGDATADAAGQTKGFSESQTTLNAKLADARSAFSAAEIEIGSAFIPAMTGAANIAKSVGDAMAKHPGIMHAAVDALWALSSAWVAFKGIGILSTITGITGALRGMSEAEIAAGGGMTSFLGAAGPIAAGAAAGAVVGPAIGRAMENNNWLNEHFRNPIRNFFGADSIPDKKAGGGALHAPGPKGKDSALFWGAAGEHVLTAGDVDAMGGHGAVHSFRNALHRDQGGPIGVPITQNADGTITSSNPAWAHLIQRESGGRNVRQGITDANSGGNEAQGYFQITPSTWAAHGGTAFAGSPLAATPQQQGIVAARILRANPSGSDWGAGLPGRETASSLLAGVGKVPLGSRSDPIFVSAVDEHGRAHGGGSGSGRGRGGSGGSGIGSVGNLPVPLDDNIFSGTFGLPGLVKFAVSSLEDLVLGPMETAVMAGLNGVGGGAGAGGMAGGFGESVASGGIPTSTASGMASGAAGLGFSPPSGSTDAPAAAASAPRLASRGGWWGSGASVPHPAAAAPSAPGMRPLVPDWAHKTGGMPILAPGQFNAPAQSSTGTPPNLGSMLVPGYTGASPNWVPGFGDPIKRATGGPSGTDTIPAWLSPGEDVLSASDVRAMGGMSAAEQFRNGLHRSVGGMVPQYLAGGGPMQPTPTPPPAQPAAATQPKAPQGESLSGAKPGASGGMPKGAGPGGMPIAPPSSSGKPQGETPSDVHNLPGLATPGADSNSPLKGLPSSPGIGISGGIIGAAESAAASAGGAFPGGAAAGAAAQIGFSELNRAASYGAQAAGIGIEGILETVIPNSSSVGGDWATTIPGRLLTGISGVRPTGQNTAGNTTGPNSQSQGGGGGDTNIGFQLNGDQHVHSNDAGSFADELQNQSRAAGAAYPMANPQFGR